MKNFLKETIKTIIFTAIATVVIGFGIICCADQHSELVDNYQKEAVMLQRGE